MCFKKVLVKRVFVTILSCVVLILALPNIALAFSFQMSPIEFKSLSRECQSAYAASDLGKRLGYNRIAPPLDPSLKYVVARSGAWHYCGALIRLRRAELSVVADQRDLLFEQSISGIDYTYSRIDQSHPWASEMAVNLARAYRGLGKKKKAFSYLEQAIKIVPESIDARKMYAYLYMDDKKHQEALKYLNEAFELSKQSSGEVAYLIGLNSYRSGNIPNAKKYSDIALNLGYPLRWLSSQLSKKSEHK